MNRLQKKILTIALGISNISFCLTAAAVATYAWYSVTVAPHVNVNSANMAIEGADPDESISYEVLKYDDDYKAGRSYTGDAAIANFKLPNYDSYIIEKNQYANVIIRAEVKTPVNTSTEEFTIDISRLASSFKTGGVIGSKTSNVIQFKAAVYKYKVSGSDEYVTNTASHNSINESSAATKYATASAYFADKKTPTTFVPIRDSGDGTVIVNRKSEADTITLIPDLPTGLNITNAIIYIECTYHPTLVSEFINSHSGDEMSYSLDGDISLIKFDKKTKTANQSDATGKYIKVESDAGASSGQYLPTYDAGSNVGKVLKGSLGTGIDVNNNLRQVTINNATASEPKSIDSTDTIDEEAFTYDRTAKTLQTRGGYYIGNNFASSTNYTVTTSTDPTDLTNDISFSNGHPVIASKSGKYLQHYSSGSSTDRIRYYNSSHPLDLYRYTENVAEMPTLVSIAITQTPSAAQRTFYTSHQFNLAGLEVTATYSDSSTAVVTNSCTFTSPSGVRTLVPEGRTGATTFSTAEASKTVYINYSEGTVTLSQTQSYTINIVAKAITSLSKSGSLTNVYYYVGDTFSNSGVTVYGEYNSGDEHVDLTSSVTFGGYNMSTAGTYTVKASYSGCSDLTIGTIYVRAKALTITPTTKSIAEGESFNITVTYNVNVTITNTNGTGSVTADKSSITYSKADKTTSSTTVSVTGATAGTATLTFSGSGVSTQTCNITVTAQPADHFTITPNSLVTGSTYQAYSGSYTTTYDGTNSTSRGWVVTFGGGSNSIGTNSNQSANCKLTNYSKYAVSPVTTSNMAVAVASTDKLYKIKDISFSYSSGSNVTSTVAYILYSSDNATFAQASLSSGTQGASVSSTGTTYSYSLSSTLTGYFAIVFKTSATSGEWKINGLSVDFNPVTLSSIAISGDCSTKSYTAGQHLDMTGLTVTATYSDGSTANVTASSTLTSSVDPLTAGTTSVTVTASYTYKTTTKTATKSVTGLTVASSSSYVTVSMSFYDSSKLSSTSGTAASLSYIQGATTVSDGASASSVVTAYSNSGNVRYGMNGGLTFGTSSATGSMTLTFANAYAVTRVELVGTHYDTSNIQLNSSSGTGSLNTKGTTLANCSNSIVWSGLSSLTSITLGSTTKRATIYTLVFTTIKTA